MQSSFLITALLLIVLCLRIWQMLVCREEDSGWQTHSTKTVLFPLQWEKPVVQLLPLTWRKASEHPHYSLNLGAHRLFSYNSCEDWFGKQTIWKCCNDFIRKQVCQILLPSLVNILRKTHNRCRYTLYMSINSIHQYIFMQVVPQITLPEVCCLDVSQVCWWLMKFCLQWFLTFCDILNFQYFKICSNYFNFCSKFHHFVPK